MKPLKVLMLLHELSRTGAPKVALDLVEALGDRIDVRFVAEGNGPLADRCEALGRLLSPLTKLPPGRLAWRMEARRRSREWAEHVSTWQPDLIYANSVMSLPLAHQLDQTMGLPDAPLLLHVHELDSVVAQVKGSLPHWLLERPARYVAPAKVVCERLVEFASINPDQIRLVPEFVREAEFMAFGEPQRSGGPVIVGGAGTPSWRKNSTLWLQVAALFRDRHDVLFRWVGLPGDPAGESFRVKRRLLGLEGLVEAADVTDEPLQAFSRFDVFLMTSWEDPFPLVVLENMMLQKAVVCTPGGGAPEEVGDAGVVVEDFQPNTAAEAVRALAADPDRRRRLGTAARERVLANFTDRVCVPKLWDVMQETSAIKP